MASRICWYCVFAYRENPSTIVCNCKMLARTHATCEKYVEDPRKVEQDEALRI